MDTQASKDSEGSENGEIVECRPARRPIRRFRCIPNPPTISSLVDWYIERLVIVNGYAHRRSGITLEGIFYAAGNTSGGSESFCPIEEDSVRLWPRVLASKLSY